MNINDVVNSGSQPTGVMSRFKNYVSNAASKAKQYVSDHVEDLKTAGKYALSAAVIYGGAVGLAQKARASPSMTVDNEFYQNDFNPAHPGNELQGIYTVTNTSPNSGANNMIDFTLPAGSNQGVYDAIASNGWTFQIMQDYTKFISGNQLPLMPNEQTVFEMYSTKLDTATKMATATAQGIETHTQFDPVSVSVPIPEPATLAILGLGLGTLLKRNKYDKERV